jgi:hypothetical protein
MATVVTTYIELGKNTAVWYSDKIMITSTCNYNSSAYLWHTNTLRPSCNFIRRVRKIAKSDY